jgi:AraC-like DNA-binding protein
MEPAVKSAIHSPIGYVEHAPPADLAAHVACVWTRVVPESADGSSSRVLPDGCADIVFGFGGSGGRELLEWQVIGPMTKPAIIGPSEAQHYVGVRFSPGFARAALCLPASELVDQAVDYRLVFPDASRDLDVTASAMSDDERVAVIFDIVRRRLASVATVPRIVRAAVRRIIVANGDIRVAELANQIGVSRQQLARLFAVHVGLTPKVFARVMRTQAAVARADAARGAYPRNVDWSAIAQSLGYYDQPHFIDEFKSMTGSTPGDWVR